MKKILYNIDKKMKQRRKTMAETNKRMEQRYIKTMLEKQLFAAVFPEGEKTEEAAQKLAGQIESAIGVAAFTDDNGEQVFGVLIDKVIEAKRRIRLENEK